MTRDNNTTAVQDDTSRKPAESDDEQSLGSTTPEDPTTVTSEGEQVESDQSEQRSVPTTDPETDTSSQTTTAQVQDASETAGLVLDLVPSVSDRPTVPLPFDTIPNDGDSPFAREDESLPEKIIREVNNRAPQAECSRPVACSSRTNSTWTIAGDNTSKMMSLLFYEDNGATDPYLVEKGDYFVITLLFADDTTSTYFVGIQDDPN